MGSRCVCLQDALLIGCSILFGTFGYRLFRLGVYDKQGELKASYHGMSLTFRQFGPGLGFALFAVAFAVVAMARGVSVQSPPADIGPTPGHTSVVTPAATGSFVSSLSQDSEPASGPVTPQNSVYGPEPNTKDKNNLFVFRDCPLELAPGQAAPPKCGRYHLGDAFPPGYGSELKEAAPVTIPHR